MPRHRKLVALGVVALLALAALWHSTRPRSPNEIAVARPPGLGSALTRVAPRVLSVAPPSAGARLAVEGVVLAEEGTPVAGATVALSAAGRGRRDRDEVRSDSAGRFRIAELAPGGYFLNAHAAGGAAGPLSVQVEDEPVFVTVRLYPGVTLTVEVVSIVDGRPVPRARGTLIVSNTLGTAGRVEAVADEQGVLRLPVMSLGNFRILAEAEGFAPTTRLLNWNDHAGRTWRTQIGLEPGVALTGRVVDESGAPVAGAQVTSRAPPRQRTQIPFPPRPPDQMRPAVVTDAEGRFRYPVPIGQGLVLVARHEDYAEGHTSPIVAARTQEVTIALPVGRQLRGRVVDRSGRPVAQAVVTDESPGGSSAARSTRTDGEGRFALKGVDARGQVILSAHAPGSRSSPLMVALPRGLDEVAELVLEHELRLAGVVVDSDGAPVPDAVVGYHRVTTPADGPPQANPFAALEPAMSGELRAASDGEFAVDGLAAGDYRLLARAPSAAFDRISPPLMANVVARAGDENVTISLPSPARIRGNVIASDGRPATVYQVSLMHFDATVRIASADGRFEIGQLDPAPQRYQLKITAEGHIEKIAEASVRPGETTDLGVIALERGRALQGRVVDSVEGAPVWNARVVIDTAAGARLAIRRTDELGRFEIQVPPEELVVHAVISGIGASRSERVLPDRSAIELRLPETGRLEVTLEGAAAIGEFTVNVTRADAADGGFRVWVLDRVPGQDAAFAGDISPGNYVVHASPGRAIGLGLERGPGSQRHVPIAVQAGQTHRIRLSVDGPPPGGAGTK